MYDDGRIFQEVFVRDSLLADSSRLVLSLGPLLKKNKVDVIWDYPITKNVEYYQLMGCIIDGVKYGIITDVENTFKIEKPNNYCLYQNYPNPFNPTTRIEYQLSKAGFVILKIYNSPGEEVAILINEQKEAGKYSIEFSAGSSGNASNLQSGIYFYQLSMNEFIQVRKMLLIK